MSHRDAIPVDVECGGASSEHLTNNSAINVYADQGVD